MRNKLLSYVKAAYPGISIVSAEEIRVEALIKSIAEELKWTMHVWSTISGVMQVNVPNGKHETDLQALDQALIYAIEGMPDKSFLVLRDFHLSMDQEDPIQSRLLKEALAHCKAHFKCLILLGCTKLVPAEVVQDVAMVEFELPTKDELRPVLEQLAGSTGIKINGNTEAVLDAASGLTTTEAENAFSLSAVAAGSFDPKIIAGEKKLKVKDSGVLEFLTGVKTADDIGGYDVLKGWLETRKNAFTKEARDYGLPCPKGLLMVGIPGTGKTLTAFATASILQRPLLKLDAGRLFGSLVGESEAKVRLAIQTAEAVSPCVLMVDEIEKAFAGSQSSGSTDGGTGSRVFATFLSWMQDKTAPVFIVATANDITKLPPEMLRKGRFDELFFVDLPTDYERLVIWNIQIKKYAPDVVMPTPFPQDLLDASKNFTGSEIEQAVIEGMYRAFAKGARPAVADFVIACQTSVPLVKTMKGQIEALRKWSEGRARSASGPWQKLQAPGTRKLVDHQTEEE